MQPTHSGVAVSELQNSVVGLELSEASASFDWNIGSEVSSIAFVGMGRMVVYTGNGDDIASANLNLMVFVANFSAETAQVVEATMISTDYSDGYVAQGDETDRLHEIPTLEGVGIGSELALNGEWLFHLQTDQFQVQEITITWRHLASSGDDVLSGLTYDDWVNGAAGNDTLDGMGGDDRLEGDLGDDRIFGDAGSDFIDGDDGHYILFGDGAESFVFPMSDHFEIA